MGILTKDAKSDRETNSGRSVVANGRTAARLAWSLWALILAVGAASLVLRYANGSALTGSLEGAGYLAEILWWDVLVPAAIPAYATVGAVVASRRPRNPVGWMCLALAVLVAAQEAGWEYAARAFEVAPGTLPAAVPVAWVTDVLNFALPLPFVLLLLFFPDGRLPSRRWRLLVWATAVAGVVLAVSRAVGPTVFVGLNEEIPNPTGVPGSGGFVAAAEAASGFVVPALLLASVVSVVARWRRSAGIERLQLKWISFAGAIVAAALLCGIARNCFAIGCEAACLGLFEPFQCGAPASLRSMMRLMVQRIIATPVSGSLS